VPAFLPPDRRRKKAAIPSAVRGTPNRHCGIAAASLDAVTSRGASAGKTAEAVTKLSRISADQVKAPS
jgi:hypothetical protein